MKSGKKIAAAAMFAASIPFIGAAGILSASAQTTGSKAATADSSHDDVGTVADPAQLINPDTAASAIEIRATPHFKSVEIRPVGQSGNDQAVVRAVLQDTSALDDLHAAIRDNDELKRAISADGASVDDVVSVTTDRNDNAIVFTRH